MHSCLINIYTEFLVGTDRNMGHFPTYFANLPHCIRVFHTSPYYSSATTKWRTAYLFLSRSLLAFPCFQLYSDARYTLSLYWMPICLFDSVLQFLLQCYFLEQLEHHANVDNTCTSWHICHIPEFLKINIKCLSCLKGNGA